MKKIITALTLSLLFLVVYILVDCSNFLSKSGLKIENINTDLLAITVSALTAFLVFYCTYQLVERWNVTKNNNLKELVYNLILDTVRNCKKQRNLLNGKMLEYIVEKSDSEQKYIGNSPANRYARIPFENEEILIQCAVQGILPPKILLKYYQLKDAFSVYCTNAVLFHDDPQMVSSSDKYLTKLLDEMTMLLNKEHNEVN